MAAKIRLARMGKIRTPHYRIVVADSRVARNSRAIEEIGRYSPGQEPSFIKVDSSRALYWLSVGAKPTAAVEALLKITGDWQKHYDLPGKEGTLRVAPPKESKLIRFETAVREAMNEPKDGATTLKKKATERLAAKKEPVVQAEEVAAPVHVEAAAEAVVEEAAHVEIAAPVTEEVSAPAAETPAQ
ncbi:MAG: 30S ribosomal protein S16 [Candidatus Nanopelagicaceae bacterium]|nr:30S ribosomal protein S16 [Candidatus Nanopelagicaceae bacterium]